MKKGCVNGKILRGLRVNAENSIVNKCVIFKPTLSTLHTGFHAVSQRELGWVVRSAQKQSSPLRVV